MIRLVSATFALLLCCSTVASAQSVAPFKIDASIGLSSLMSLGDAHLKAMAASLETIAASPAAQSGDWARISPALAEAAKTNVPAVLRFARPDGTYWTVSGGRQKATVADRGWFARAMSGNTDIGELVTSRATGKPVAVVAVPVRAADGHIVGILGASIFLDQLSATIANEMGMTPGLLFWAIDGRGVIAIHSDPTSIFMEPAKMSDELKRVQRDMLANDEGTDSYTFRGKKRVVIYRKSPLTGWRYGFGMIVNP
jgi:hypothetical protein